MIHNPKTLSLSTILEATQRLRQCVDIKADVTKLGDINLKVNVCDAVKPKIRVHHYKWLSEEFRKQYQEWLNERFGFEPIIPPGTILFHSGTVIGDARTMAAIKNIDVEATEYSKLHGKYKHYCPDWDYMAIDETCPEWDCCTCKFEY